MENSQPARRGRPPLPDEQDTNNGPQTKRQRMRLAQRAYRARKQQSQASEKNRTEELSDALDHALATYSKLHQRILGSLQSQDSLEILLHLNDAVTSMAAIASSTNKAIALPPIVEDSSSAATPREPGSSIPTPVSEQMRSRPLATSVMTNQHGERSSGLGLATPDQSVVRFSIALRTTAPNAASVSARMFRACFERVVSLLSTPIMLNQIAPTLTIPLHLLGEEALLVNSLQSLSLHQTTATDYQYPPHSTLRPPRLYRVLEGGSRVVPRAPAPYVQQIVRGRTRTILDTPLTPMQGEWLEAVDVEEYLEERGICLRNAISSSEASTGNLVHQAPVPEVEKHPSDLVLSETAGESEASPVDSPSPRTEITENLPAEFMSAESRGHEPADYSVFGLSGPRRRLPHANISTLSTPEAWALATDAQSAPSSDFDQKPAHAAADASHITVDLDKLVYLLAENATCLGPVPGIRKEAVDSSIRDSIVPEHRPTSFLAGIP